LISRSLLVVAGESSADLLAARVIERLGRDWTCFGVGGARSQRAGLEVLRPVEALNLVGLSEVLTGLPRVFGVAAQLVAAALAREPDRALLVDLPDFNMGLGPLLARLGIPVTYLGAPQAWAWREGRARTLAGWVDELACLFPFEPKFFAERGAPARFVGHPRAFELKDAFASEPMRGLGSFGRVALLPGSRRSEIARHAPVLKAALTDLLARHPGLQWTVCVAPTLSVEELRAAFGDVASKLTFHVKDAAELLAQSDVALVASGTAVTECVILGVPCVTFYAVSALTYGVARRLVRIPHISMANILAGSLLVPELVQSDFTPATLNLAFDEVWNRRDELRSRFRELARTLLPDGSPFDPAERVANGIRARH